MHTIQKAEGVFGGFEENTGRRYAIRYAATTKRPFAV